MGRVEQYGVGVDLDVHAIAHLTKQGLQQTNDLPKYNYASINDSSDSDYSIILEIFKFIHL